MKLLVDESLSTGVRAKLTDAGHDAVHVGDLGLMGALDEQVMAAAAAQTRVLISADTDFGDLLALGRRPGPSVVILRRVSHNVDGQAALLVAALAQLEDVLLEGAVVSLSPDRARIRKLPIDP